MLQAIQALSASITSASSGQTFPNVTIPNFELHGTNNNKISKALQVSFAPLIERSDREKWEAYSRHQQDSQDPAWSSSKAKRTMKAAVSPPIHGWAEQGGTNLTMEPTSTEFGLWGHAPVWQQAPAPRKDKSIVNFDLLSHPVIAQLIHGAREAQQAVLSQATPLKFLYGGAVTDEYDHPHSILLIPIYPSLKKDHHDPDDMVGLLAAVVSWDTYFSNILHKDNDGLVVVLHNACGEHFTYRIDGPEAIFLGQGDHHDPLYNGLEIRTPFAPFLKLNHSSSQEHCEYDLRMYPSTTLKRRYTSKKPGWYAAAIILIFSFTALTFLLFDYAVALRQRKIVAKAKRTHAIVSSLFPTHVRDQLLHETEEAEEQKRHRKPLFASTNNQVGDYMGGTGSNGFGSKPMAELYPSATVMVRYGRVVIRSLLGSNTALNSISSVLLGPQFADIVGFTAWSSAREPIQVFTLLETVYQAFDEIAKRRRVFKVSTVLSGSGSNTASLRYTHTIFTRWKRLEIAMWQFPGCRIRGRTMLLSWHDSPKNVSSR
jgi:CHASE domain/Adenylate and Guanylate cyclase catalytic domain